MRPALALPRRKRGSQLRTSAPQPRHHRAGRAVQHHRNFLITKTFNIPQHNDLSIRFREFLDRRAYLFAFKLPQVNNVRIASSVVSLLVWFKLDESWTTLVVPQLIEPRIAHNDKQPRLQIPVKRRLVCRARRSQISFLDEILGLRGIARKSHGISVERIDVREGRLTKDRVVNGGVHGFVRRGSHSRLTLNPQKNSME